MNIYKHSLAHAQDAPRHGACSADCTPRRGAGRDAAADLYLYIDCVPRQPSRTRCALLKTSKVKIAYNGRIRCIAPLTRLDSSAASGTGPRGWPAPARRPPALRQYCVARQPRGRRARDAPGRGRRDGVHDAAGVHPGDDGFQDDVPGHGRRRDRSGAARQPGRRRRHHRPAAGHEHRQPERAAAVGDGARGGLLAGAPPPPPPARAARAARQRHRGARVS